MAVFPTNLTDLAADPSQDPNDVVADTDPVAGVGAGERHGISGAPEAEIGGSQVDPNFGVAGAFTPVDDATFVPPGDNTVGAASQQFPGQRFSDGFLNEKAAEFGHVTEGNLITQDRPNASTPSETPKGF